MRPAVLRFLAVAGATAASAAFATSPPPPLHRTTEERVAAQWVQDELRPFSSETEFRRYMRDVRRAARARGRWWARTRGEREGTITVTGSRIIRRNASITNVQEPGVDEGDLVKQIDRFLIVLQDGRLFSIDTQATAGGGLALADRINVYRRLPSAAERDEGEDWYDEILVHGDRIVVTGYSYGRNVSDLAVFRLTEDGRFERDGAFEITSDDYYSRRNYATRLIGDSLLVYTPFDVSRFEEQRVAFPSVRRVDVGGDGRERRSSRRLLDHRNLYGPLMPTLDPTIHSVSICPLGRTARGRSLSCRTRGFIGPGALSFYVAPTHVYFWIGPDQDRLHDRDEYVDCPRGHRAPFDEARQAVAYRIPIASGDPEAVRVRGEPVDQFSFDEEGGALRAFVTWNSDRCDAEHDDPMHVSYLSLPLSRFSRFAADAPASDYAALPPVADRDLANRFTSTHLAYAPLHEVSYDEDEDGYRDYDSVRSVATELVVVPLARPAESRAMRLGHNVRRLEVLGDGFLVEGGSAGQSNGTSLSLIGVDREPRIASSLDLPGRSGGEGRSHAFNLLLRPDGSGLFGLPTVSEPAGGWGDPDEASWSLPSDLSFFSLDAQGGMRPIGLLASAMPRYRQDRDAEEEMLDGEPDPDAVPGYSCEVSCVDWYGNSRPIFTDGRIFALSATELIEGRLEGGRIVEVRRLDFARATPRGR